MSTASAIVLALVFFLSGVSKARRAGLFAERLADFEVVPPVFVTLTAWSVIAAELGIATVLIVSPLWGSIAAGVALVGFSATVALALASGKRSISCGCFGQTKDEPLGVHLLVRNGGLIALAVAAGMERATSLDGEVVPVVVLLAMFGAVVFVGSETVRHMELVANSSAFRAPDPAQEAS